MTDHEGIQETLDRFANAVIAGDTTTMCSTLVGQARDEQGCGTTLVDIGPRLYHAIQRQDDIAVESVGDGVASATMPDRRPILPDTPAAARGRGRQQLRLEKVNGRWYISELRLNP